MREEDKARNVLTRGFFEYFSITVAIISLLACSSGGGGGDNENSLPLFVISGFLVTEVGNVVDSDVNDPRSPFKENDSKESSQLITSPSVLGGYLNIQNQGAHGRSFESGDLKDCFKVTLSGGEKIQLTLPDGAEGLSEMTLGLYDSSFSPVGELSVIGKTGFLTVSDPGSHFICVEINKGASIYKLSIGPDSNLDLDDLSLLMENDFVTGEAIVQFIDDRAIPNSPHLRDSLAGMGIPVIMGGSIGPALVSFKESSHKEGVMKMASDSLSGQAAFQNRPFFSDDPEGHLRKEKYETLLIIKGLQKQKGISYAQPNFIRKPFIIPQDTYYPLQWSLPMLNLPRAWEISKGDNVIVAVIDTGVLLSHPDLQSKLVEGYDFIRDPFSAGDGDSDDIPDGGDIDSDPDDPGDSVSGKSSFHGTHVAGIIGASTSADPSSEATMAGIGWNTKIMPIRVLGVGGGTDYDISQGILYAAGLENCFDRRPNKRADIINMSFGGKNDSRILKTAINSAYEAGVILVAAAGNEGSSAPYYPAAYDEVISVSAVDINGEITSYSNFGATIDIAAPGGDNSYDFNRDGYADGILSAVGDDSGVTVRSTYTFYEGTSMAAPHVAGVIALMKSINPNLNGENMDLLIRSNELTTYFRDGNRDDSYGYGLLDGYKAVLAASESQKGTAAYLSVRPKMVRFRPETDSMIVHAEKLGSAELSITDTPVESKISWLSVTPEDVDPDGFGSYRLTANRSGIDSGGISSAILRFVTAPVEKTIRIPVFLETLPDGAADIGLLYILLVNSADASVISVTEGLSISGSYTFSFSGVPSGSYFIVAGTDLDNDGYIGDEGEAYGASTLMTVDGNRPDIVFTGGFSQKLFTFSQLKK